jgi:hypothetical protein
MASLWWGARRWRLFAPMGVFSALAIVISCSSSTPIMAVLSACLGGAMFVARRYMRWVQLGIVATLFGLHMVMNKPVWHLIARADIIGGSTGWHRYHLVDNAIRHFEEWALTGVQSTAHWGWGLQDVTNQYVLEGVRGGALTLALFVATIFLAFGCIGGAMRKVEGNIARMALVWSIGVALFVHCMSFIAVSYFGQSTMLWYMTLAMAAGVADVVRREHAVQSRVVTKQPHRSKSSGPVRPRRKFQHA